MSARSCMCASEMCRRFGCQKDAELLREYQAERAKALGGETIEETMRRVFREELNRHFGPKGE